MSKVVDIEKIFADFVKEYLVKNKGKIKPDEIESRTAELYDSFETTPCAALDGKIPKNYYADEKDLLGLLKKHVEAGIPVNEYLTEEIKKRVDKKTLAAVLTDENEDEEVIETVLDILVESDPENCVNELIAVLFNKKLCSHAIDDAVDALIPFADEVAEKILKRMKEENRTESYFVEILSHCLVKRDEIKKLITDGISAGEKVPEYANYARIYDDESMLPDLKRILASLSDYVSYKELKMTIESLGGEADERDFTYDKDFIAIKAAEAKAAEDERKD